MIVSCITVAVLRSVSVLFSLRGLQKTVSVVSSIDTAYVGKHHLTFVVIKHRDHMYTSYVNITQK